MTGKRPQSPPQYVEKWILAEWIFWVFLVMAVHWLISLISWNRILSLHEAGERHVPWSVIGDKSHVSAHVGVIPISQYIWILREPCDLLLGSGESLERWARCEDEKSVSDVVLIVFSLAHSCSALSSMTLCSSSNAEDSSAELCTDHTIHGIQYLSGDYSSSITDNELHHWILLSATYAAWILF